MAVVSAADRAKLLFAAQQARARAPEPDPGSRALVGLAAGELPGGPITRGVLGGASGLAGGVDQALGNVETFAGRELGSERAAGAIRSARSVIGGARAGIADVLGGGGSIGFGDRDRSIRTMAPPATFAGRVGERLVRGGVEFGPALLFGSGGGLPRLAASAISNQAFLNQDDPRAQLAAGALAAAPVAAARPFTRPTGAVVGGGVAAGGAAALGGSPEDIAAAGVGGSIAGAASARGTLGPQRAVRDFTDPTVLTRAREPARPPGEPGLVGSAVTRDVPSFIPRIEQPGVVGATRRAVRALGSEEGAIILREGPEIVPPSSPKAKMRTIDLDAGGAETRVVIPQAANVTALSRELNSAQDVQAAHRALRRELQRQHSDPSEELDFGRGVKDSKAGVPFAPPPEQIDGPFRPHPDGDKRVLMSMKWRSADGRHFANDTVFNAGGSFLEGTTRLTRADGAPDRVYLNTTPEDVANEIMALNPHTLAEGLVWPEGSRQLFDLELSDPEVALRSLNAWGAANQNRSTDETLAAVLEMLQRTLGARETTAPNTGLGHENIVAALRGVFAKTPTLGAAKLPDFTDANLGRLTRAIMADNPMGGEPVPGDLWAARIAGHMDEKFYNALSRMGVDLTDVRIDGADTQPENDAQYERATDLFRDALDILIDRGWRPSAEALQLMQERGANVDPNFRLTPYHIMAIEWVRLQAPVSGAIGSSPASTADRNRQPISPTIINSGAGWREELASLPPNEQAAASQAILARAIPHVLEALGGVSARMRGALKRGGPSPSGLPQINATGDIEVLGSMGMGDDVALSLGYLLDLPDVTVHTDTDPTKADIRNLPTGDGRFAIDLIGPDADTLAHPDMQVIAQTLGDLAKHGAVPYVVDRDGRGAIRLVFESKAATTAAHPMFRDQGNAPLDASSAFAPKALAEARSQSHKSRQRLVRMDPREFLDLVPRESSDEKRKGVEKLLNDGVPLSSIPVLSFRNEGGGRAVVEGHEGRHRALALAARGFRSMPVLLESSEGGAGRAIRFGSQQPGSFDRVDDADFPQTLTAQRKTNPRTITFPLERGPDGSIDQPNFPDVEGDLLRLIDKFKNMLPVDRVERRRVRLRRFEGGGEAFLKELEKRGVGKRAIAALRDLRRELDRQAPEAIAKARDGKLPLGLSPEQYFYRSYGRYLGGE